MVKKEETFTTGFIVGITVTIALVTVLGLLFVGWQHQSKILTHHKLLCERIGYEYIDSIGVGEYCSCDGATRGWEGRYSACNLMNPKPRCKWKPKI